MTTWFKHIELTSPPIQGSILKKNIKTQREKNKEIMAVSKKKTI